MLSLKVAALKQEIFLIVDNLVFSPDKKYVEIKKNIFGEDKIAFSDGILYGIQIIREMAFYRIKGFKKSYCSGDFDRAKELLLQVANSRELIINDKKILGKVPALKNIAYNKYFDIVFGREPLNLRSAPYWNGSYVKVLMDAFWELNLNLFDFKKLPRDAEKIFDREFSARHPYIRSGRNFIIDQAKAYTKLTKLEEVIVFITCLQEQACIPKDVNNIRNIKKDYIFSEAEIAGAKKYIIHKYGSIENFKKVFISLKL